MNVLPASEIRPNRHAHPPKERQSLRLSVHKREKVKECAGVFDLPMGCCNRTRVDLKALLKSKCLSLGGTLFPLVHRDHIKNPHSPWNTPSPQHEDLRLITTTGLKPGWQKQSSVFSDLPTQGRSSLKINRKRRNRGQLRAC